MITTRNNFELTNHNTFAIPAMCRRFVEYDSAEDIPVVLQSVDPAEPVIHIGAGSNMLFTRDFPGTVIHSRIKGIEQLRESTGEVWLKVGAGVEMNALIKAVAERHLWGLENLADIPGEVGSSAVQNVGAYGVEAGDVIDSVCVWDRKENRFTTLSNADCRFAYRDSLFKHADSKGRYIIHAVVFKLSSHPAPKLDYPALKNCFATPPASPAEVSAAISRIRGDKLPDPAKVPSAGSFFKNPVVAQEVFDRIQQSEPSPVPHYPLPDGQVKIPAAWLIEQCGWKGTRRGNAAVWHLQPLVLVNPERKASPDEIIALENEIIESVKTRFGITLSPEVEHI